MDASTWTHAWIHPGLLRCVLKQPMLVADLDRDGLNYAIVQVAKYLENDLFDESDRHNFIIPFCGPLPY